MKIVNKYSHLHGEEFMLVRKKALLKEVYSVIASVDAKKFRTKVSEEKTMKGAMLYSPGEINNEFKRIFESLKWNSVRRDFYVSDDYSTVKVLETLTYEEQKKYLQEHEKPLLHSYNQTDFVKDQVAIEVQLGKYFAVTYDLFVKHLSFYNIGIIDVGIEIVPSKNMQQQMSSGVPFFEKEVHNVLRHGRTTPPVPIIILGVDP
jgi:hypothetical protein